MLLGIGLENFNSINSLSFKLFGVIVISDLGEVSFIKLVSKSENEKFTVAESIKISLSRYKFLIITLKFSGLVCKK